MTSPNAYLLIIVFLLIVVFILAILVFKRVKRNFSKHNFYDGNNTVVVATQNAIDKTSPQNQNEPAAIQQREEAKKLIRQRRLYIQDVNGKNAITFKRISTRHIGKKKFVAMRQNPAISVGSKILPATVTSAAFKAMNPSGLFKATAPLSDLVRYSNDTFSSIVKQGGKIVAHSGFVAADAVVFAPMIIMQVLSIITGQYYLNGITKQLNEIHKAIQHLIHLDKYTDIGDMAALEKTLSDILNNEYPASDAVVSTVITYKTKAKAIFEKYYHVISDKFYDGEKLKGATEKSKVKNLHKLLESTEVDTDIQILAMAKNLEDLSDIVLFYLYAKLCDKGNKNYEEHFFKLYEKFKIANEPENNQNEAYELTKKLFDSYIGKIDERKKSNLSIANKYSKDKVALEYEKLSKKRDETLKTIKEFSKQIIANERQITDYMEKPRDAILAFDADGNKTYFLES